MSNLASIVNGTGLREAGPLAMGPARVIEAGARRVRLRREDGAEVDAELALASPYEPAVDDVVLCVGDEVRHYVIGVLVGSGRTQLSFQGDVDLQALVVGSAC